MEVDGPKCRESEDLHIWGLEQWNTALYRHYFAATPSKPANPVVRLYITAEQLLVACGCPCAAEEARTSFVESIKAATGRRSLATDACRRRKGWNPDSGIVPPFLSHLLLTCMVANDLAEELSWTGNFRIRLSQILGTYSQPQLDRLRPLWEELAEWSVRQNLAGVGCRQLRLPRIPNSGYLCIIGYSIRLAVPSRRDHVTLATLFKENGLDRQEPELGSALHLVSANIGRFSADFAEVFNDFVSSLKSHPMSVLFHTTFWSAVREVTLSGVERQSRESSSDRIRLELEDDDGRFWLTLTSEAEHASPEVKSLPLPNARSSPFRFRLTDAAGNNLATVLLSTGNWGQNTKGLSGIRAAIAGGILLFEETDDYISVLSRDLPSSGEIRALVSNRLNADFKRAAEAAGLLPDIVRSEYAGWSEWRGLNADGLRRINIQEYSSLADVRCLRLTIPPPDIKFRGGIRIGGSFVGLPQSLPTVEIAGAERVELVPGQALERSSDRADTWSFPPALLPDALIGTRRIVAFAESVIIAEREIDFIKSAFTSDYKQPTDSSRWLVESTGIDAVSFSDNAVCVTPVTVLGQPRELQLVSDSVLPPVNQGDLLPLITILCARLAAQRGISEGELLPILEEELGLRVSEVWPILRGWVEGGMLEVLSDARWRGRTYFGRNPHMVVHRASGDYEGVLVGLVPPYLLERFESLSSAAGLSRVRNRNVSEFVPALPRVRSASLGLLSELAEELDLPPLARVRPPEELLYPVRALADQQTSTANDSWPVYRRWDWQRRSFTENPHVATLSEISVEWCRRDDGPDRYKLYRNGVMLWWTRSRTWAMLAAFTFADLPVFTRGPGAVIESQGDSLYLPLPLARIVSWLGPMNPGPVKLAAGKSGYRYTFPDVRTRELILSKLWPNSVTATRDLALVVKRQVETIIRSGTGPVVPVPAVLRSRLANLCEDRVVPPFVPGSCLPQLYSALYAKGKESA